jgi:hypothetical protein
MPALTSHDTMSTRHLESSYVSAYQLAYNKFPKEFRHIGGKYFMIDGDKRDRRWLIQEVSRLQKMAQENFNRPEKSAMRNPLMRLIRRFAGAK